MHRLAFILLALVGCLMTFGQAFTPRRPFITTTAISGGTPIQYPTNFSGVSNWWHYVDLPTNTTPITNWVDRIGGLIWTTNGAGASYGVSNTYLGVHFEQNATVLHESLYGAVSVETNSTTWLLMYREAAGAGCILSGLFNATSVEWTYDTTWTVPCGSSTYADYFGTGSFFDQALVRSNGTVFVYTNGVLAKAETELAGVKTFNGAWNNMGADYTHTAARYYGGYLQQMVMWPSTNLSASNISDLHTYGVYSAPITILSQPVSVATLTNTICSFTVSANNALWYSWFSNGVALASGNMWSGVSTNTLWVTNNTTLFTNLAITCTVSNIGYSVTSSVAYLTVMNDAVTNGLVAWWRFDEGSGTTTADSSGTGNGGHLTNSPPWVSGKYTNALYFPFASSWGICPLVRVTNSASLNSFTAMTLAGWVYVTNATANGDLINKKTVGEGSVQADPYSLYELWATTTNASVGFATTSAGSRRLVQCAFPNSINTWCHYVGSYDGTFIKLYRNGVLLTNYNAGSFTIGSNAIPVTLGAAAYSTAGLNVSLVGFGDDFRIYNRALNTNEVNALSWWTGPQQ